jgi:hypothetical protein
VISCPECGHLTRVTETRGTPSGARRRRRCKNGHLLTTLEIVTDVGRGRPIGADVAIIRRRDLAELVALVARVSNPPKP